MPDLITRQYCPRCDKSWLGRGKTAEEALKNARTLVREHLVRAQGADLDDGLHDNALEQWDATDNGS